MVQSVLDKVSSATERLFSIGTLSHLSGLPASTIRTWERRYNLLQPTRSASGRRLYSRDDLTRLRSVIQRVDQGLGIADAAQLSDSDLLQPEEPVVSERNPAGLRAGCVHPALSARLAHSFSGIHQVFTLSDPAELATRNPEEDKLDLLLLSIEHLGESPRHTIQKLKAQYARAGLFIFYHFAAKDTLEALRDAGATVLQDDWSTEEIIRLLRQKVEEPKAEAASTPRETNKRPRFSAEELGRLREIKTPLECECPQHLSKLLSSMLAFEKYSLECVESATGDEQLHLDLYRGTGEARQVMEGLLVDILIADGLLVG